MNENCHYGDHDYLGNARCKWCGEFNGKLLATFAWEKAERLGLAHGAHFHKTKSAKNVCQRFDSIDDEENEATEPAVRRYEDTPPWEM